VGRAGRGNPIGVPSPSPTESTTTTEPPADAVLLDLDGTLVDTVYLHVRTWSAAFAEVLDRPVPEWRIHACIGLPGDRLIRRVLGEVPEEEVRERLSRGHRERFLAAAEEGLRPTRGALELLHDLDDRGVPHVVATAAGSEEREALMAALGHPDIAVTDADDLPGGKPDSTVMHAAAAQLDVDASHIRMLGDAPWDGHSARAAGLSFVAVRTGGFGDDALRGAGASMVFDDPADCLGVL